MKYVVICMVSLDSTELENCDIGLERTLKVFVLLKFSN